MIELYAVKLNNEIINLNPEIFSKLLPLDKMNRIKRFYKKEDMFRALVADILTRWIISKKFKINLKDIIFEFESHGKPFIKNIQNIHFNNSHSGDWIVCAVHELPIGIDIEKINPIDFAIAKRFFSETENIELFKKEGQAKLEYFFDLWTLKESYIKATGKGLSTPLNAFSIFKHNNSIKIKLQDKYLDYYFKQYNIDNDYKLAVCALKNEFPENVKIIDFLNICEEILDDNKPNLI